MKVKVYEIQTYDNNYNGDGPIWYSGEDVHYAFEDTKHQCDHLKEPDYTVRITEKTVEVSEYLLTNLVYKVEGWPFKLAEELYNLDIEVEGRCRQLINQLIKVN